MIRLHNEGVATANFFFFCGEARRRVGKMYYGEAKFSPTRIIGQIVICQVGCVCVCLLVFVVWWKMIEKEDLRD